MLGAWALVFAVYMGWDNGALAESFVVLIAYAIGVTLGTLTQWAHNA